MRARLRDLVEAQHYSEPHIIEYKRKAGEGRHCEISHYELNFDTMKQSNTETGQVREFQFMWTSPSPGKEQMRCFVCVVCMCCARLCFICGSYVVCVHVLSLVFSRFEHSVVLLGLLLCSFMNGFFIDVFMCF